MDAVTARLMPWLVFVIFLNLFLQFPIMAPFARSLGAEPALAGIIVGLYSLANIFGNLGAGPILDRWGRKRPLVVGLLASGLVFWAHSWVGSPVGLLWVRLLHGSISGVLTPGAFAIIGDLFSPGRRGRAMGVNGASIALAALVGPPIAGILQDRLGFVAVFYLGGSLLLLGGLIFALLGKETLPSAARPQGVKLPLSLFGRPRLLLGYAVVFMFTMGLGVLIFHFPLRLADTGASRTLVGMGFTVFTLMAMGVMWGPPATVLDRWDRARSFSLGLVILAAGTVILSLRPHLSTTILGMSVCGLGFGILFPTTSSQVADGTLPGERGMAFGIFYALYSLGVVTGSFMAGLVTQAMGIQSGMPFLIVAALALMLSLGSHKLGGREG